MATEIEKLLVSIIADTKGYVEHLNRAQSRTKGFTLDAEGRIRDMAGRFVSNQELMQMSGNKTLLMLAKYGKAAEKVGNKMKKMGAVMSKVGRQMSLKITAPLIAGITGTVFAASKFESSFAGVRKTVNASKEEFAAMAQGMRDLSQTIPVSVNELNAIGESAGQLGISKENILSFTRVMADLGVATNLTSEQAATAFAQIANITGLAQTDFDRLGSALVALGNNSATTEATIAEFGLRLAGAGTLAGLTEPEILAIGAAMGSLGISAEAGGTAMQKVLLEMDDAANNSTKSLAVFAKTAGKSSEEFAAAWKKDAASAFNSFVVGLGKQGKGAVNILKELNFTDQRLIKSMLSLANAGDLLSNSFAIANTGFEENTALAKEAEERYKTFASQLILLKNTFGDVAIRIGQILQPAITSFVKYLKDTVIPAIKEMVDGFKKLNPHVQKWIGGFVLILGAMGPVLMIMGPMVVGIGNLIVQIGILASSAAGLVKVLAVLKFAMLALPWVAVGALAVGAIVWAHNFSDAAKGLRKDLEDLDRSANKLAELGKKRFNRQVVSATSEGKSPEEQAKALRRLSQLRSINQKGLIKTAVQAEKRLGELTRTTRGRILDKHAILTQRKIVKEAGMREKANEAEMRQLNLKAQAIENNIKKAAALEEAAMKKRSTLSQMLIGLDLRARTASRKKEREEAERVAKQLQRQAQQFIQGSLSPMQKFKGEIASIKGLIDIGALTEAQGKQAIERKQKSLIESQSKTGGQVFEFTQAGTAESFRARAAAKRAAEEMTIQKQHTKALNQIVVNTTPKTEGELAPANL